MIYTQEQVDIITREDEGVTREEAERLAEAHRSTGGCATVFKNKYGRWDVYFFSKDTPLSEITQKLVRAMGGLDVRWDLLDN